MVETRAQKLEPTPYVAPPTPAPAGNVLTRACVAVFKERRVPYTLSRGVDRLWSAAGRPEKTVLVDGFRIRLRRNSADERIIANVVLNRDYNPPGYEIRPDDTVVDIGGHIGTFSLVAGRAATRGRVFTFEPHPESFRLLRTNLRLNGLNNVIATQAAVTSQPGKSKMFVTPAFTGGHSILPEYASDLEEHRWVDGVTLQSVFLEHSIERCQFLKLDCEGAEFEILHGLPEDLFERIDRIAMEFHATSQEKKREEGDGLVALLSEVGYRIDAYIDFVEFRCGFIRASRV